MFASTSLARARLASVVLLTAVAWAGAVLPAHAGPTLTAEAAGPAVPTSKAGPRRVAPASTAPASVDRSLTVASYNVRCSGCRKANPLEQPWAIRRPAVVKTIRGQSPDVLGLQEAGSTLLRGADGKRLETTQFEDLVDALGYPYAAVSYARSNCVVPPRQAPCEPFYRGASATTKIVYNERTMKLISAGSKELTRVRGDRNQRFVAWAILEQKATKTPFFFADTHFQAGTDTRKSSRFADVRRTEALEVVDAIAAANSRGLPTILVGDFNANRTESGSRGAYATLKRAGLEDPIAAVPGSDRSGPATAERRIHADYATFTGFVLTPSRPGVGRGGAGDYLLTSPMRVSEWETVVDLDRRGRVRGTIPSDHNMIRATVWLPQPRP